MTSPKLADLKFKKTQPFYQVHAKHGAMNPSFRWLKNFFSLLLVLVHTLSHAGQDSLSLEDEIAKTLDEIAKIEKETENSPPTDEQIKQSRYLKSYLDHLGIIQNQGPTHPNQIQTLIQRFPKAHVFYDSLDQVKRNREKWLESARRTPPEKSHLEFQTYWLCESDVSNGPSRTSRTIEENQQRSHESSEHRGLLDITLKFGMMFFRPPPKPEPDAIVLLLQNGQVCYRITQQKSLFEEKSSVWPAYLYDSWEPIVFIKRHTNRSIREEEKRFIDQLMNSSNGIAGFPQIYGYTSQAIIMKRHKGDLVDLVNSGAMTDEQKQDFMIQMSDALVWLHDQGWVHRDVKPENFLYDDKTFFLTDFEFIECPRTQIEEKKRRSHSGSPMTFAPEILRIQHFCDISHPIDAKGKSWGEGDLETKIKNAKKLDSYSFAITLGSLFFLDDLCFIENQLIHLRPEYQGHLTPEKSVTYYSERNYFFREFLKKKNHSMAILLIKNLSDHPSPRNTAQEIYDEATKLFPEAARRYIKPR